MANDQKRAAHREKMKTVFEKVSAEYLVGKRSMADLEKAYKQLSDANHKQFGESLDFVDMLAMAKKREKKFAGFVANASLDHLDKTTWKLIKKEAGIKKSGFLKKADANVGSNITKFKAAHAKWAATRIKLPSGDLKLLQSAIAAGEALQTALKKFVAAKEFKTDLAKNLQAKCEQFIRDLDADLGTMRGLSREAADTTTFKSILAQCTLTNFK